MAVLPKTYHHPLVFVYSLPLRDNASGVEHIAHATGILKPEPLAGRNRGPDRERVRSFTRRLAVRCCFKSAEFILKLKTNYELGRILDPDIPDLGSRNFGIPGSSFCW